MFTSLAFAKTDLEGAWKFQKMECSSGAKPAVQLTTQKSAMGNGSLMAFNMVMKFQGNKVDYLTIFDISFDQNHPEVQTNVRQAQAALAILRSQPSSPENQQAIQELTKFLALMKQSVTCETRIQSTFKAQGGVLEVNSEGEISTTKCVPEGVLDMDDDTDAEPSAPSKYSISGNTLKMHTSPSNVSIGEEGSQACPPADDIVMIFSRQ